MVYEAREWNSCAADKRVSFLGFHLPLGDHVHGLDATYDDARATEVLEAQHRSCLSLDGPVILVPAKRFSKSGSSLMTQRCTVE
jgi:hypothetical protein